MLLIEKKKANVAETELIRQKVETFYFEDEEKLCKYSDESFKKSLQAQEERLAEHLLSVYQYIVGLLH